MDLKKAFFLQSILLDCVSYLPLEIRLKINKIRENNFLKNIKNKKLIENNIKLKLNKINLNYEIFSRI